MPLEQCVTTQHVDLSDPDHPVLALTLHDRYAGHKSTLLLLLFLICLHSLLPRIPQQRPDQFVVVRAGVLVGGSAKNSHCLIVGAVWRAGRYSSIGLRGGHAAAKWEDVGWSAMAVGWEGHCDDLQVPFASFLELWRDSR